MSLLHLGVDISKKPRYDHRGKIEKIRPHPWEKTVKPKYLDQLHHVHNSIRNPERPKKKVKQPPPNRNRFQIFGDRFSDDFLFCTKLVSGLYKYRWRKFEAPIIAGSPSAEWPNTRIVLQRKYGCEAYCAEGTALVILNNKFLGGRKELKQLIDSKYVYYLMYDNKKEIIEDFAKFVKNSRRPTVYMHISVDNIHVGTMIFSLFADIVPLTCENFLRRCREKKGGYSGTPIHRIVKDSWIQCGGFTLKASELSCENFIVPLDKRGVLAMANDGRDIDCSTQFFILLQPQDWMNQKYTAFGQLIDGEYVLKQIEERPTWYEAPVEDITIYMTGIFNMDCPDIWINPHANEYIQLHIENLFALGNLLRKELEEMLEAKLDFMDDLRSSLWELLEKGLDIFEGVEQSSKSSVETNADFDVEGYLAEGEGEVEAEQYHAAPEPSIQPEPELKYYIPLTDVPYPDEVDSIYAERRFLQGDYCFESDLREPQTRSLVTVLKNVASISSTMFSIDWDLPNSDDNYDNDMEYDVELKEYLRHNLDRVSFAGGVIRGIGRGKAMINIFENARKSEVVNLGDDDLRRLKLLEARAMRRVVISTTEDHTPHRIKRRQTGFEYPVKVDEYSATDLGLAALSKPKVVIVDDHEQHQPHRIMRRPTAFAWGSGSDTQLPGLPDTGAIPRHSTTSESHRQFEGRPSLERRRTYFDDNVVDPYDEAPTLKHYRPINERETMNEVFNQEAAAGQKGLGKLRKNSEPEKGDYAFLRTSYTVEDLGMVDSEKELLKASFDEERRDTLNSLRSFVYARHRPTLTIAEYQEMNRAQKKETEKLQQVQEGIQGVQGTGIRLPGDTPLYLTPVQSITPEIVESSVLLPPNELILDEQVADLQATSQQSALIKPQSTEPIESKDLVLYKAGSEIELERVTS